MTEPELVEPAAPQTGGRRSASTRDARARRGATTPRPRARVSVIGVLGEVLITAGVLVLAFLGWQQWLNNLIVGQALDHQAVQQSQTWTRAAVGPAKTIDPAAPPVITASVAVAERFATMYIPRFGAGWARPIAQGVGTKAVLNKGDVGHYPTSQMPGAIGNFAVASHRTTYGANFGPINNLQVGDHIYVETIHGWYQYSFRNLQYVAPTGVGVLDPVPEQPGTQPTDRMMTMTSCNPKFSAAERIVAYSSFDKFYPRAAGAPAEIAATVSGKA